MITRALDLYQNFARHASFTQKETNRQRKSAHMHGLTPRPASIQRAASAGATRGFCSISEPIIRSMDCKLVASTNRRYLPRTLQEMVADYLGQIRAIQPAGPYHLLGWSFGGLVAYSLGSHLQLQGEQVPLLVLLDSYPPGPVPPRDVPDEQEIINEFLRDLGYDPAILGERPLQLSTLKELLRQKESIYSNLEDKYLRHHPKTLQEQRSPCRQFCSRKVRR